MHLPLDHARMELPSIVWHGLITFAISGSWWTLAMNTTREFNRKSRTPPMINHDLTGFLSFMIKTRSIMNWVVIIEKTHYPFSRPRNPATLAILRSLIEFMIEACLIYAISYYHLFLAAGWLVSLFFYDKNNRWRITEPLFTQGVRIGF